VRCLSGTSRDTNGPRHSTKGSLLTTGGLALAVGALGAKVPFVSAPRGSAECNNRRRWALAAAVTLVVPLLELIPPALLGKDNWWRLGYFLFATPLLIVLLTAHHGWLDRRGGLSSLRLIGSSVAMSLVVGAVTAKLYFVVVVEPLGRPCFQQVNPALVLGLGALIGLGMCAIWALGFLYPFTAYNARLRSLEFEAHAIEAEKLQFEAAQLSCAAELSRLRSQLEPHFLLNTLNSIAGLVTQRPRDARRLLGCLGDLLRDAMSDGEQLQTLDLEVTWLKRYAEILESRHAGFLSFSWHIQDETRSALVPRLLLQPLLENAVNHGALCRPGGGEVTLRTSIACLDGGALEVVCIVEDNGPGVPDRPLRPGALGLRSVRRRLELEFAGATFDIESTDRGTRSVVRLPQLLERNAAGSAAS